VAHERLMTEAKRHTMTQSNLQAYSLAQQRIWFAEHRARKAWSGAQASQEAISNDTVGLVNASAPSPALPLMACLSRAHLLDMQALTKQCGRECTHDGIHFADAVSHAALQIVLLGSYMCK
jgi:hypothetical protein